MIVIQVFEPALCSCTDANDFEFDQSLIRFTAEVNWVKQNGVWIDRFNLARQPLAFAENQTVRSFLDSPGKEVLPLVLLDGNVVLSGRYPNRGELAKWSGIALNVEDSTPAMSGSPVRCRC
jgi:hypothetical protein